jgi:dTDP-4-amino-4,6-dideoxygalactose transaminase
MEHNEPIPFSPPRVDETTIERVTEVLRSGWITTGPQTAAFEAGLSAYIGGVEVVALNSWTNACELILRWYGVGEGDEVIIPAYTYAATANIVIHCGATPVLVDSAPGECLMDLDRLVEAITPNTKVIMPVDIGGLPIDYDAVRAIIENASGLFRPKKGTPQEVLNRILFLADAAHSFGATYKGKQVGLQADITGYSFHAVKNLTTAEGGALALNLPHPFSNAELKKALKISSLHGQTKDALSKTQGAGWRYDVVEAGYKCNMTDLQAAIGNVELERYAETLAHRKHICDSYTERLHGGPFDLPTLRDADRETSYHLFQVRLEGATERDRDTVIDAMREKNIATNVHFQPLPLLTFYKTQGYTIEAYPNAAAFYANEISLPVWYGMTDLQIERVASALRECWKG